MALTQSQLELLTVTALVILIIYAVAWYASKHPDQF